MWTLLLTAALAEPTGFYHPQDISLASERFMSASEKLQAPFQQRSNAAETYAAALRQYETALDLLGDDAPAAERERLAALEKDYNRQFAKLQAFADELVADFDGEFSAAMERALAEWGGEAKECMAEIPTGPRVPGMGARTEKNPDCTGENLNARIAEAIDTDDDLGVALAEILALEWPAIELQTDARPPVGDGERWLYVYDLVVSGARDELRAIDTDDETKRMEIEAAIEQGADTEALKKLTSKAEQIDAETASRRAAVAAPVLETANALLAKWSKKGEPETGWCANPEALGGCTGTDASRELVGRLVDDKKMQKVF